MAYDFDGTNDGISLGNAAALNPTAFSVSLWLNLDSQAGGSGSDPDEIFLFARDHDTLGRSYGLALNVAIPFIQINGSTILAGGTTLSTGTNYYLGYTGQSGAYAVYVNGVSDGTSSSASTPASTTGNTTIGQREYSGFQCYTNGRIAEVGFWNVVLNASEMAALAKGYSPLLVRPGALISYVPLVRALVDYKRAAPTLIDAPTAGFAHPRIIMPRKNKTQYYKTGAGFLAARARQTNIPVLGTGLY